MENEEYLIARVERLQSIVDELMIDRIVTMDLNGGGMVGEEGNAMPIIGGDGDTEGCYEIDNVNEETGAIEFKNPYYGIGGKTYSGPSTCSVEEGDIVALKISATGSQPACTIETYAGLAQLQGAQLDLDYYIVPLYKIGEGYDIKCDFRKMVNAAMGEFL